ncbi:hypothetical protein PICSAR35_03396 [Mycobacterium avium subsp. paratuberculosis]|nr:hypothetical protein PICSAR35_03396 [Mycobacterium avium subsp. paratuberculosis]
MLAYKGTHALPALDVALRGQVRQRPSHRDARDPELIAQRLLGGQRLTRGDDAAVDFVVQHQKQLAVQRHTGGRRHRAGLVAALLHDAQCFHTTLLAGFDLLL